MTCHAIYWQKARTKSKTSVAQTVSQPSVYAKGLKRDRRANMTAKKCNWVQVCQLHQQLPCSHVTNVNTVPLPIHEREICDRRRQELLLRANTDDEGSVRSEESFKPRSQTRLQTAQTTEIHFCGTERMDTTSVCALLWQNLGNYKKLEPVNHKL
jgi:hypothetical protein